LGSGGRREERVEVGFAVRNEMKME
jgi:hypothetical protein